MFLFGEKDAKEYVNAGYTFIHVCIPISFTGFDGREDRTNRKEQNRYHNTSKTGYWKVKIHPEGRYIHFTLGLGSVPKGWYPVVYDKYAV